MSTGTILNCRAVQPFVEEYSMSVKGLTVDIPRMGSHSTILLAQDPPTYIINLASAPKHVEQVSVFVDGFRLVNTTLDFGRTWTEYNISGSSIVFTNPVTGRVDIYVDNPWVYILPDEYMIPVDNVQGAETTNTVAGRQIAGLFCEPLILSLPTYGFVRLSDDHQNLIYVPNRGFVGKDAFSYTVLTDRGQIADPKCVYVTVTDPS